MRILLFPTTYDGYLPQCSTDYIAVDVRGAETLVLRLRRGIAPNRQAGA
jgi:hypothetical protein